jgi:hypothetical protein
LDWPVNSASYFQLSSKTTSPRTFNALETSQAPRSSPPPLDKVLCSNRKKDRANAPGPQPRTTHEQHRTKTDDRSTGKSVIFNPNICHQFNGFNMLSHTHTHPQTLRVRSSAQSSARYPSCHFHLPTRSPTRPPRARFRFPRRRDVSLGRHIRHFDAPGSVTSNVSPSLSSNVLTRSIT